MHTLCRAMFLVDTPEMACVHEPGNVHYSGKKGMQFPQCRVSHVLPTFHMYKVHASCCYIAITLSAQVTMENCGAQQSHYTLWPLASQKMISPSMHLPPYSPDIEPTT